MVELVVCLTECSQIPRNKADLKNLSTKNAQTGFYGETLVPDGEMLKMMEQLKTSLYPRGTGLSCAHIF